MPRITATQAGSQNLCAVLDTIAFSEITAPQLVLTDDGYNVLVGSTPSNLRLFDSYAAHPNIYNKRLDSTAAGRYQELARNWKMYSVQLKLPDFGPISQDLMALQQIRETGAMPLFLAGHFAAGLAKISHLWASLPGADYGQHENDFVTLRNRYVAAGGVLNG